jgi:putative sterol carrier protein
MPYEYGTQEWEDAYRDLVEKRLEAASEPYINGSPEWVAVFEKLVQEDAQYKEDAKDWEGSVVLVTLANPEEGIEEDIYLLMDLWHGECRSVRFVPKEVGEKGDFIISSDDRRWRQVREGELDATKALMQGKMKLRGDLPKVVRSAKATMRLTELSSSINAIYPDDMDEEAAEEFERFFNEFRTEFGI